MLAIPPYNPPTPVSCYSVVMLQFPLPFVREEGGGAPDARLLLRGGGILGRVIGEHDGDIVHDRVAPPTDRAHQGFGFVA